MAGGSRECVCVSGCSIDAVKKVQRAGKICVLDIDVQVGTPSFSLSFLIRHEVRLDASGGGGEGDEALLGVCDIFKRCLSIVLGATRVDRILLGGNPGTGDDRWW
jgi:hypothetical protein